MKLLNKIKAIKINLIEALSMIMIVGLLFVAALPKIFNFEAKEKMSQLAETFVYFEMYMDAHSSNWQEVPVQIAETGMKIKSSLDFEYRELYKDDTGSFDGKVKEHKKQLLCHNAGKGAGLTIKLSDVDTYLAHLEHGDDLGACEYEIEGLETLSIEAVVSNDIGPGCSRGDVLTAKAGIDGFRVEEHKGNCSLYLPFDLI
jgi:hypothetical protein